MRSGPSPASPRLAATLLHELAEQIEHLEYLAALARECGFAKIADDIALDLEAARSYQRYIICREGEWVH